MNSVGVSMGVSQSCSIKNIFYDKMDLRLFYFHVMVYPVHHIVHDLPFQILITQA